MLMLDSVQDFFMNSLVGGIGRLPDKPEAWSFVGLRMEMAVSQLLTARALFPESATPTFLDCGSGLAFVTALARGLGFRATGVEWSEACVATAKRLFPSVESIQGDVMEFTRYGDYDVIHYYGPFADEDVQRRFEEKVEAEAKTGAVIIGNRKASNAWRARPFELLSQDDGFMGLVLRKISAV
jgi:hypothetical protein